MKNCTKCNEPFPRETFPLMNKATGRRYAMCSDCKKQYDRDKWHEHKHRRNPVKRVRQKAIRDARRNFIVGILQLSKCVDCDNSDWRVLEFDHRVREDKLFNIADSVLYSEEKISKEIEKCDIVCANCHRIRTIKQLGYYQNITGISSVIW